MKKIILKLMTGLLVSIMLLSTVIMAVSCDDNSTKHYDPETRPLTFSISALDGTFNPFFTTSATDSEIAHFTQISMLNTTNDGQVACGEDEPTVVLDYSITSYNENNEVAYSDIAYTTYKFVIKNGIKFSDGVDLTIDDVLFNLYVYLDPMYTGSSTIYSIDIQGLKAYRYNDITIKDNSDANMEQTFSAKAVQRYSNLLSWSRKEIVETEQILKDVEACKEQFLKDLQSDWTAYEGQLESSFKEYSFTEDWESFYLNEGLIGIVYEKNKNGNSVAKKNEDDKYITDLDENPDYTTEINEYASDETRISEYMAEYSVSRELAISYIKKDFAINKVYNTYAGVTIQGTGIQTILQGMTTGSNMIEIWTKEEQSNFYAEADQDVKSISGITTEKVTSFNGVNKVNLKGEEHDVLCITINGIDPKAIWSFGYAVAPMHYYSDSETLADKDSYPYGVRARNKKFFDEVLNSNEKNALPVGAGAYRASNEDGNASNDPSKVVSKDFWKGKKVYFERNDYFYTVGEGIENAKIRRIIYEEVSENNILNRLIAGEIDYGTPSATPDNKTVASAESHLATKTYKTNGYGYVGINPKFVKNIYVRRAIMMALDTSLVIQYYGGQMAEVIYRPMTKLSWAYPEDCGPYYSYDATGDEIEKLVEKAGYTRNSNDIYQKGNDVLKFKFTIAGDTTDHPAAQMFEKARQLLNQHGFEITVGTDVSALKKLATGGLAVWAAAWTSTIDPDMYQIYHMDTQTTNRKNWNYDEILNTSNYPDEQRIVIELSALIDEGRKTENQEQRTRIYAQALDKIMELAVEFPCYQRMDLAVYNKDVIDSSTMNQIKNLKYSSPIDRIWELNYN